LNLLCFAIAFALSFLLSFIFSKVAERIGLMDKPKGIKDHFKPTPYGGGIAIFLGTLVSVFWSNDWKILVLGFSVFLLGFLDDIRPYSRYLKLFFQSLVAAFTVWLGIKINIKILPEYVNIILSIIWIVGITNAFNIIDVMDGISAGVGFFAAFGFIFISVSGVGDYPVVAAALAGSCFGFLPFNLPKAKVFMGDSGSLFLGYMLAVLAITTRYTVANPIAVFVPLLILFVPIFDTVYVVVLRIAKKQNPLKGSHDHFVLKLKATGLSVPSIVAIIYLATIALCEASFIITRLTIKGAIILYSIAVLIFIFFGIIFRSET
jgi:UDP-GlcNAc:undecaprenyl-phosphate GlcNAc-1-phosphate transferase